MSDLAGQLAQFSQRYDVSAVGGGLINAGGDEQIEVTGVCHRGSTDPIKLDDLWHIGSCAKAITAVLFARLVEQGRTRWDVSVASLFPDLADQISPGWQDRTIEDVFVCQAGMQANPDKQAMLQGFKDQRPLTEQRTDATIVALSQAPKVHGKFVYSNLGYMVVGAAIDRLTGMTYEQALQQEVMQPLGITSLGFGPPPRIRGHHCKYRLGPLMFGAGTPAEPTSKESDNPPMLSSAGTLHMSLADWAKFLRLFITQGGELLAAETIDYLFMVPGTKKMFMAKGWATPDMPGIAYAQQGSNTMWSATAMIDADLHKIAFVTCNDGRLRVLQKSAQLAQSIMEL